MPLRDFLNNPEWDSPFFKQLARNDTGQAIGHQGGMVLPKVLRKFLPYLDEAAINPDAPTIDRNLGVEMFVGTNHLVERTVRYQFQTWGGTRPAESRMTDGFAPLRKRASEHDIIIFQRRADSLDRFRLILVKANTSEFREIRQAINGRRWGVLFPEENPVDQTQLSKAVQDIQIITQSPFQAIRAEIPRVETRQKRIARSSVFRECVRREYTRKCAVSAIIVATPTNMYEVEAAHVVPISEGGTEDIRNGFALAQTLHWAFDRGLFGVSPNRTVYIPRQVKNMPENAFLRQFESHPIAEAATENLRVHPDAFRWHFDHLVMQWD